MKTIWKYELKLGMNEIEMPEHAHVLTVQLQADHLELWSLVRTEKNEPPFHPEIYKIYVVLTGEKIPDEICGKVDDSRKFRYISSIQKEDFTYHVFECEQ